MFPWFTVALIAFCVAVLLVNSWWNAGPGDEDE